MLASAPPPPTPELAPPPLPHRPTRLAPSGLGVRPPPPPFGKSCKMGGRPLQGLRPGAMAPPAPPPPLGTPLPTLRFFSHPLYKTYPSIRRGHSRKGLHFVFSHTPLIQNLSIHSKGAYPQRPTLRFFSHTPYTKPIHPFEGGISAKAYTSFFLTHPLYKTYPSIRRGHIRKGLHFVFSHTPLIQNLSIHSKRA